MPMAINFSAYVAMAKRAIASCEFTQTPSKRKRRWI
jgi:hypothetical protein